MNTKHGLCKHPLYNVWKNMMGRCYNDNFKTFRIYGGRGIEVCKAWRNLETFITYATINGWKEHLQIDRVNNNDHYRPSNIRFVPCRINASNTRRNTTGLIGVQKSGVGFRTRIKINEKFVCLGTYKTAKEAAAAYDDALDFYDVEGVCNFNPDFTWKGGSKSAG